MEAHFTATAYIIKDGKTLLINHKKLNKWLPPGGHIDPNETPAEAASREVREETGLEIEFIRQENVWINRWNAKSFDRPYLCLLEEIPAHGGKPTHKHIDMIYLATPIGGIETANTEEIHEMRWFSIEEIEKMEGDVEIFEETRETIRTILNKQECIPSVAC